MNTKKFLTREQALSADDLPREEVDLTEEWGGWILVRAMTAEEADQYEGSLIDVNMTGDQIRAKPIFENARARLVAKCAIDEEGNPLFNPHDVIQLGKKNSAAISKIVKVINRISKRDKEARELLGKDSERTTEGGSNTD